MTEAIMYIDTSVVREGKLAELKSAITDMAEFIEGNETRIVSYGVYLNEDGSRMKVVHAHPDSASMELHMTLGGPVFAKFKDLIQLTSIEVFGNPSDRLRQQLLDKARMLGGAAVTVHDLQAGFTRFGSS